MLPQEELPKLAGELRQEIIEVVSKTGGHLAPSLGVVELTVALHYSFDTPHDKIVWDVGHQAYAHKLLTGRRERFPTLRQHGGISGFPKREESPYDHFDVGHASTSISARARSAAGSPAPSPPIKSPKTRATSHSGRRRSTSAMVSPARSGPGSSTR